jgi:hypothetical protein
MHRYSIADPRVEPILQAASTSTGTVVFVHCGVLTVGVRRKLGLASPFDMRYSNPIDLHPVALLHPNVQFVIPHFGAGYLREALMTAPVLYTLELLIRERLAKTGLEIKGRRKPRQSRQAKLEVRAASVRLRPPPRTGEQTARLPAVTVNAVIVCEIDTPAGEEPVEWILLTTLPIDTPEQVKAVVEYYCVRWQIEILFKTLKSGCRIEERRFEHVERTERALGLYLIAAWRTMFVTWMRRQCPDMNCQAIFEPSEWKAVWMAVHRKKPPKKAPPLREIVHLIASLGGYVERPKNEPGAQTIWIGLQRMYDLAWAWDAFGPEARKSGS